MKTVPANPCRLVLALLSVQVSVLLAGCATARASPEPPPAGPRPAGIAAPACGRDADCVVKDVGNCCGYYPACVHRDKPVDPEGVQRECREKGLSSICGFAEITACACVDGACTAADSPL